MPWSSGTFTRSNGPHQGSDVWEQDRDAGVKIVAARHDTHDQDLATGINACLTKDGSNGPTADLPMANQRHTNVANATARTQYAAAGQVQDGALMWGGTSGTSGSAYTIGLTPALSGYTAGLRVAFIAHAGCAAGATLNVDGRGARALQIGGTALAAADIEADDVVEAIHDGSAFQIVSVARRVRLGDGTQALPALTFDGDADTGLRRVGANEVALVAQGADALQADATRVRIPTRIVVGDGTAAACAVGFDGDPNTGLRRIGSGTFALVCDATDVVDVAGSGITANAAVTIASGGLGIDAGGLAVASGTTDLDGDLDVRAGGLLVTATEVTVGTQLRFSDPGDAASCAIAQDGAGLNTSGLFWGAAGATEHDVHIQSDNGSTTNDTVFKPNRIDCGAVVRVPAGDVSTPNVALGQTGFGGTGVYFPTTTSVALAADGEEVMRVDGAASVPFIGIGTTAMIGTAAPWLSVYGDNRATIASERTGTGSRYHMVFFNPNGQVGVISTSGSSTAYGTSSDYRLKQDVTALTGALDRLNALRPVRFAFRADPSVRQDGFIAHEVAPHVPAAVIGERDAVHDDGSPAYQQIDHSALVPLLTAAVQELAARVAVLEDPAP